MKIMILEHLFKFHQIKILIHNLMFFFFYDKTRKNTIKCFIFIIPVVKEYKYLGILINNRGKLSSHLKT